MNEFRPNRLKEVIGQDRAKRLLSIAIAGAKARGGVLGHTCMSGAPGTGKTSIAVAVAHELGVNVRMQNGASIAKFKQLIPMLDALEKGDVVFIDEIHRLPAAVFENLYTTVEDFRYDTPGAGSVDVRPFCLMAATTHMGKIPGPMRTRFTNFIDLEPYSLDEMTQIVKRAAKKSGLTIGKPQCEVIARTCRGVPRLAVNRTAFLRDYMLYSKRKSAKAGSANKIIAEVLELQGVDQHGLTLNDYRYLEILYKTHALSLDGLANKLNIEKVNITTEIEPYLMSMGLIHIERPHGRVINRDKYKEILNSKKKPHS